MRARTDTLEAQHAQDIATAARQKESIDRLREANRSERTKHADEVSKLQAQLDALRAENAALRTPRPAQSKESQTDQSPPVSPTLATLPPTSAADHAVAKDAPAPVPTVDPPVVAESAPPEKSKKALKKEKQAAAAAAQKIVDATAGLAHVLDTIGPRLEMIMAAYAVSIDVGGAARPCRWRWDNLFTMGTDPRAIRCTTRYSKPPCPPGDTSGITWRRRRISSLGNDSFWHFPRGSFGMPTQRTAVLGLPESRSRRTLGKRHAPRITQNGRFVSICDSNPIPTAIGDSSK